MHGDDGRIVLSGIRHGEAAGDFPSATLTRLSLRPSLFRFSKCAGCKQYQEQSCRAYALNPRETCSAWQKSRATFPAKLTSVNVRRLSRPQILLLGLLNFLREHSHEKTFSSTFRCIGGYGAVRLRPVRGRPLWDL